MTPTATGSASSAPPARSARRSSRCSPSAASPPPRWSPFASERSAGTQGRVRRRRARVPARCPSEAIQGLDLVLSSAGGAVSAEWAPKLVEAGAVVVDNTSYWRMHDDVPLVVAEVNPEALDAPPRDRRQPELLDDADGRRAGADPPRRRASSGSSSPPTSRSPGPAGGRSRSFATQTHARAPRARSRRRPRSIRTGSPSTSCPRSRPSRTATTTRPRSAR